MNTLTTAIRQEAARILGEGIVDVVVGFEAGTMPLKARPVFIVSPDDAVRLILNGFCQNNLAAFITRRPQDERIGIVCRGCETRALQALVIEHQHERNRLYVIGVPCIGVLDWRKIERQVGENVLDAAEGEGEVLVTTRDGEHRFGRSDLLHESCARCLHPNPVGADIVLGELVPETGSSELGAHEGEFSSLSPEERYAAFVSETERCIRCYACREACPMCYCVECFVDHTTPRWAETTASSNGRQAWHIIRAFHQTGRCVSCGACERACPTDIRMTYLTDKLNDDMRDLYDFEVGMSEDRQPPFAAFSLDDRKRFVR